MYLLMMISISLSMIFFMVMLFSSLISKKSFMDREKSSPFECGFDPKSSARMPFSLHFFMITIMFLIFDIEISLLMPFILIMKFSMLSSYFFTLISFLIILIFGLYYEWSQGSLSWSN